jgi:hypothetical protein
VELAAAVQQEVLDLLQLVAVVVVDLKIVHLLLVVPVVLVS